MWAFPNFIEALSTWINIPMPTGKSGGALQQVSTNIDGVPVMCSDVTNPTSCSAAVRAKNTVVKQNYQSGSQVNVNTVYAKTYAQVNKQQPAASWGITSVKTVGAPFNPFSSIPGIKLTVSNLSPAQIRMNNKGSKL